MFKNTKEAMEYAQRNNIPAVVPLDIDGASQADQDAKLLFEALENFQGDWYLYCLGETSREDVNAASSREAMKLLKRLQSRYRAGDLQEFALATKPKTTA